MLATTRSLIQVLVAEILAALLLASVGASLLASAGFAGCPGDQSVPFGITQVVFLLLGLLLLYWSLRQILLPKLLRQGLFNLYVVGIGDVRVTVPGRQVGVYYFPSSHPSYALVELLFFSFLLIPAHAIGFQLSYVGCTQLWSYAFAWGWPALAFFFPLLRLLCWYGLGRTLKREEVRGAHRATFLPIAIAAPVVLFLVLSVGLPIWTAPTLSPENFAGGLAAHGDYEGQGVKIEGVQLGPVITCACAPSNAEACQSASLQLDLGKGGIVVIRGASNYAAKVQELAKAGEGARHLIYGELTAAPPRDYGYQGGTCPADPFPSALNRPRAYLEYSSF